MAALNTLLGQNCRTELDMLLFAVDAKKPIFSAKGA